MPFSFYGEAVDANDRVCFIAYLSMEDRLPFLFNLIYNRRLFDFRMVV